MQRTSHLHEQTPTSRQIPAVAEAFSRQRRTHACLLCAGHVPCPYRAARQKTKVSCIDTLAAKRDALMMSKTCNGRAGFPSLRPAGASTCHLARTSRFEHTSTTHPNLVDRVVDRSGKCPCPRLAPSTCVPRNRLLRIRSARCKSSGGGADRGGWCPMTERSGIGRWTPFSGPT